MRWNNSLSSGSFAEGFSYACTKLSFAKDRWRNVIRNMSDYFRELQGPAKARYKLSLVLLKETDDPFSPSNASSFSENK